MALPKPSIAAFANITRDLRRNDDPLYLIPPGAKVELKAHRVPGSQTRIHLTTDQAWKFRRIYGYIASISKQMMVNTGTPFAFQGVVKIPYLDDTSESWGHIWARIQFYSSTFCFPQSATSMKDTISVRVGDPVCGILEAVKSERQTATLSSWTITSYLEWKTASPFTFVPMHEVNLNPAVVYDLPAVGCWYFPRTPSESQTSVATLLPPPLDLNRFRDRSRERGRLDFIDEDQQYLGPARNDTHSIANLNDLEGMENLEPTSEVQIAMRGVGMEQGLEDLTTRTEPQVTPPPPPIPPAHQTYRRDSSLNPERTGAAVSEPAGRTPDLTAYPPPQSVHPQQFTIGSETPGTQEGATSGYSIGRAYEVNPPPREPADLADLIEMCGQPISCAQGSRPVVEPTIFDVIAQAETVTGQSYEASVISAGFDPARISQLESDLEEFLETPPDQRSQSSYAMVPSIATSERPRPPRCPAPKRKPPSLPSSHQLNRENLDSLPRVPKDLPIIPPPSVAETSATERRIREEIYAVDGGCPKPKVKAPPSSIASEKTNGTLTSSWLNVKK